MRTQGSSRDEGSYSLNSLKERMTSAAEPTERAASSCPSNTWLEGLRTSFEPDSAKKPKATPGLIAGRLRSA